jgi:hypothetical protein
MRTIGILLAVLLLVSCTSAPNPIPETQTPTHPPTSTPVPTLPPTATTPPKPNEYITIAQLNLWYHGSGCYGGFEAFDCSGKRTTALTPLLGKTYDRDRKSVV